MNTSSPTKPKSSVTTDGDDSEVQTTQRRTVSQPSQNVNPATETAAPPTSTEHTLNQPVVTEGGTPILNWSEMYDPHR